MFKPPNASLTDVRWTIKYRRVIEFDYFGKRWRVEPHDLVQSRRRTLVIQARTLEGPEPAKWVIFRFAEMRALKVLHANFEAREIPPVLFKWEGPGQEMRPVGRGRYSPTAAIGSAEEGFDLSPE